MKISLSGLPATGKTTFGVMLATSLKMALVCEAAADLAMLGANVGPAMTFETLAAIMLVQMARESEFAEDFVTDRGPLDMLAYARILRHHATQATSNLISSSIETVARSWLERAHYDLIVYHDALCGARGSEMKQRNSEYLKQLAECFESIIADLQLDVVRMPGDLTVEARCSLITNMLVQ